MKRKRKNKVAAPTEPIDCFRCQGEGENSEGEGCSSCSGSGSVIPGPLRPNDEKLIRRFVHCQWWLKLRTVKAAGRPYGRRKERVTQINRITKAMLRELSQMSIREQQDNRVTMGNFISRFELLSKQPPEFNPTIDEPSDMPRVAKQLDEAVQ